MKFSITMAAVAVAFAAGAQGVAKGPGCGVSYEPLVRAVASQKFCEKVGISAEQVAKLKVTADDKAAMKELQERLRKGVQRQAELLQAPEIDEKAVMAAVDEVWEVRKLMAKQQTARIVKVRTVLTPDQVGKALDELKAMRGRGKASKTSAEKKPAAKKAAEKAAEAKPAAK
ncbi:MAG: periplasmic heavy metal sensor [Kiritimatiellae bacterium]|nr:periplasmic heavy metal sensor [Kiritimatiellia bacterium]